MTTKEMVLRTLGSSGVSFDESVVGLLEQRIEKAIQGRRRNQKLSPLGLAFTTARNWAVSQKRKSAAAARRTARELLAAEQARLEKELYERCREEFDRIFFKLLPDLRCSQPKQLQLVKLVCFEGLSLEECAEHLPGTSDEQRFKWKARGFKLVMAQASPELQQYLRRFLTAKSECKK